MEYHGTAELKENRLIIRAEESSRDLNLLCCLLVINKIINRLVNACQPMVVGEMFWQDLARSEKKIFL